MSQDPRRVDPSVVAGVKPAPFPGFVEPCHPTLREELPSGPGWVHEVKFDGYRIQARKNGNRVELLTRKGLDWTDKLGPLAAAFRDVAAKSAVIDGELVVEAENGASSFSALQTALKAGRLGEYTIGANGEIVLGPLTTFNADNIDDFDF